MKSLEKLKDVIDGLFDENIRKNYKRKEVEKDLEQVYQDLEVLELLKKKTVNILLVEESDELIGYNYSVKYDYQLTREEFDKLKQWLEEK